MEASSIALLCAFGLEHPVPAVSLEYPLSCRYTQHTNMKADAFNFQSHVGCLLKKLESRFDSHPKFLSKLGVNSIVILDDSDVKLRRGMILLDFSKLIAVVYSGGRYSNFSGVYQRCWRLDRICIEHARGRDSKIDQHFDLTVRSTIEVDIQRCKLLHQLQIRIAFQCCESVSGKLCYNERGRANRSME